MKPWTAVEQWSRRAARAFAAGAAAVLLAACGGGGGGGAAVPPNSTTANGTVAAGANVLTIVMDKGFDGRAINAPFVTVRVCQPGTSACIDVDHVLLDTGSNGLRIAASALPAGFNLPQVTNAGGAPVGECARFASGYAWGSVRRADVTLASETAAGIPVQVVDDRQAPFTTVPAACSSSSPNLGVGAGARGIIGVGLFAQDCGTACAASAAQNVYFGCTTGGCSPSALPLASQVLNPIAALPVNNNGVVVVLPPVPAGGLATGTGSLILGIGTQANNALGNARVHTTNARGFVTVSYQGATYPASFLDTGSNGIFIDDPTLLPTCGDFYCPPTPAARSATLVGANGAASTVDFLVDNVSTVVQSGAAVGNLAGPINNTQVIDFGLPFFFGRTVFVARSGSQTPAGPGPYWAW